MPLSDLQKFLENSVPGSCVLVDLLKIAKSVGYRRQSRGTRTNYGNTIPPFTLLVDGENCLDRLYGGFYSDWVCGGQWNRMLQFLAVLVHTVQNNNIELAIFFNGASEQQRINEWIQSQNSRRKHINSVLRHVCVKGTPPPKVLWISPTGLRMCLRMALRHLGIRVVCSMDDHHQEVIAFCRENAFHGLMAEDAEYIVFDPPRYFSSRQLKLTYKGSLETKEFILEEIAKSLNLPRNFSCVLATLLGNYLLSENELGDFYVMLVPEYTKEQCSQETLIHALIEFIKANCDLNNLMAFGSQIFGSANDQRVSKFIESVQYFLNGTKDGFLQYKPLPTGCRNGTSGRTQSKDKQKGKDNETKKESNEEESNCSVAPPVQLPSIPHEVSRTASERHQKGLMCPWIYQVITHGEIKMEPNLQDETCSEFPHAVLFFQLIRQYVYAILFNLHHHSFMARMAKDDGQIAAPSVPEIRVKEWIYSKENPYGKAELVEAISINWAVPTVQRLWFGTVIEDKKRRLRAFLTCLHSDSPLMLQTCYVPQHMLIMATVLRYILSRNEFAILRRQELDSFLVTAFSPDLSHAQYLQDLQIPQVNSRAVQLASFFMVGVEMAVFANDSCGSPIPLLMCCPWLFFDGKLFHSILIKANNCRSLIEVCDGDEELVEKVERCKEAILEGLNVRFLQTHSITLSGGLMMPPAYEMQQVLGPPPVQYAYHDQQSARKVWGGYSANGRNGGGSSRGGRLYSRGGQLQVAGIVVGQWGPNFGSDAAENSSNDYMHSGRGRLNNWQTRMPKQGSTRGRPAILAKRKMIRRKEVRTPKGPPPPPDSSHPSLSSQSYEQPTSHEYSSQQMLGSEMIALSHRQMNGGAFSPYGFSGEPNASPHMYPIHPQTPTLAPFHSHISNHNNNGLKSPDSGVNVSILE